MIKATSLFLALSLAAVAAMPSGVYISELPENKMLVGDKVDTIKRVLTTGVVRVYKCEEVELTPKLTLRKKVQHVAR